MDEWNSIMFGLDSVRTTDGASLQILATHTQHNDLNDVHSLHRVMHCFYLLYFCFFLTKSILID